MILDKSTEAVREMWQSLANDEKTSAIIDGVLDQFDIEMSPAQFRGVCYAYKLDYRDPKSKIEIDRILGIMRDEALLAGIIAFSIMALSILVWWRFT